MLDRGPRSFGPFRAVIRIFPGDAFAPPPHSSDLDAHQQDAAAVNPAKARFKKMHERHMNFTQSYGFDFHDSLWINPDLPYSRQPRLRPASIEGSKREGKR